MAYAKGTRLGKSERSGIDLLVIAALFSLCGSGIWGLEMVNGSAPDAPLLRSYSPELVVAAAPDEVSQPATAAESVEILEPTAPVEIAEVMTPQPEPAPAAKPYTPIPSAPAFITLMGEKLNQNFWHVQNHANRSGFYGGDWKAENASFGNAGAGLAVKHTPENERPFTAAEIQTFQTYGYGRYEAVMRPAAGSGLVSTFFTYTGPYFGDPHDEIDFEFVGNDLTKVELNYWRDGKRGAFKKIHLPFDAGKAEHLYAFEWSPDKITWYVDDKIVYETQAGDDRIPRTPGKIYFSNWTGTEEMAGWHGRPTFDSGTASHISCVSFVPKGETGRACSDFYLKPPTLTERIFAWFEQPAPVQQRRVITASAPSP